MKKNYFLFLLVTTIMASFSIGFSSCSSDDDDEGNDVKNTILGTWEETDYTDGTWQWTFNTNGNGICNVVSTYQDYSFNFTYTLNENVLTISGKENGKPYSDTYSVTFSSDKKTMTWIEQYNGNTYTTVLKKK